MTLTRHTWRFLAAIFVIVAYVVPSFAHSHAGHAHGGPSVAVMHVDHSSEAEISQVEAGQSNDPVKATKAHAACCATCACCGATMISEGAGLSRSWLAVRLSLGRPEAAPPSQAPEALPEPPRSFA